MPRAQHVHPEPRRTAPPLVAEPVLQNGPASIPEFAREPPIGVVVQFSLNAFLGIDLPSIMAILGLARDAGRIRRQI